MRTLVIVAGGLVLLLIAVIGMATLYRWGNDTGMKDFRANEPILLKSEADGAAPEEIAGKLLGKWLNKFKTPEVSWAARLKEYEVIRLDINRYDDDKIIVSATFSVMPTRWSFDNWLAGSGGTTNGSWIRNKFTRFVITKNEKGYQLKELGPGPL